VLFSAADNLGLDPDSALRLACGFGAGVAREGEVCGAVSGGLLALSLKYGRGEGEERARTDNTYAVCQRFVSAFRARHGSIVCRDLTQCDLRTPQGQEAFKANDLLKKLCTPCVATAAEWVQHEFAQPSQ
jgi:C_GCAxxG_C_C family probable redox protein